MRGAREPAVTAFRSPAGLRATTAAAVRSASAAGIQERVGAEDPVCGAGNPRSNGRARHRRGLVRLAQSQAGRRKQRNRSERLL